MAAGFTENEIMTIFRILGTEPVKDENVIRNAYRQKLTVTNPEDDQEGFMRLRAAYERALEYCKQKDEPAGKHSFFDDTPAGMWLRKADEIYCDFEKRKNPKCWEDLFFEDYFQDLEGEGECIDKMLVYLTRHFYFPSEIWKILDKYLGITTNTARLKEKIPGPFVNMMVSKCRNGEAVNFDYFEGPRDGEYDMFLSLLVQCEGALYTGKPDEAERLMAELQKRNVSHPSALLVEANLLFARHEDDAAIDILKNLTEKYPDEMQYRSNYARQLSEHGRLTEAAVVYQRIIEDDPEHYMANRNLAAWCYETGDFKQAKKHAEKVLKSGGDDKFSELLTRINDVLLPVYKKDYEENGNVDAAIDMGWCFLQNRNLVKGLSFVKSLEDKVPEKSRAVYYSLLAKMYFENVFYKEALETTLIWRDELTKKMKADRKENTVDPEDDKRLKQTYLVRALGFEYLGHADSSYYREALTEIDKYEQLFEPENDMLYEKAELYFSMGDYQAGLKLAEYLTDEKQFFLALTVKLKCCARLSDAAGVLSAGRPLWHFYPKYARAYEEVARVFRDFKRKEELEAVLAQAEKNGVSSIFLESCRYSVDHTTPGEDELNKSWREFLTVYYQPFERTHDMKLFKEGLPIVTRLYYEFPSNAVLNMRALMNMEANDIDEGEKDLNKILEIDPYDERALNNIGLIHKFKEKYDDAVVALRKAILYTKENSTVSAYRNLAGVFERMGEYGLAAETNDELRTKLLGTLRASLGSDARVRMLTDDRNALRDAAKYFALDGRLDDALRLLDGYGRNTDLLFDRIAACEYAGDFEKAKDEARRAVQQILNGRYDASVLRVKAETESFDGLFKYLEGQLAGAKGEYTKLEIAEKLVFLRLMDMESLNNDDSFAAKRKLVKKRFDLAEAVGKMRQIRDSMASGANGGSMLFLGKYSAWIDFLDAAGRDNEEDMNKAYERLTGELRCRNCRFAFCLHAEIAKAMLLSKKGKTNEAESIYNDIQKKMSYDFYSYIRLKGIADKQ